MRAVMLDVPEALVEERRRLGIDGFDEMWEGELHSIPDDRPLGLGDLPGRTLFGFPLGVTGRCC